MTGAAAASSPRLLILAADAAPAGDRVTLTVVPADGGATVTLHLRDAWAAASPAPAPGDISRVVLCSRDFTLAPWDAAASDVVVDDDRNLFVLHPDTLVSGTAVADSFVCLRKSVLSGRNPRGVGAAGAAGPAALNGSMIHDLFQAVVVAAGRAGAAGSSGGGDDGPLGAFALSALVEDLVSMHAMDVYSAGMRADDARTVLMAALPGVLRWAADFLGGGVRVRDGKGSRHVRIDAVRDIEESVWSPAFGLKGKIDATVVLASGGGGGGGSVVPVELKTGSAKGFSGVSHHAQVVLYALLMSDRYEAPTRQGLLSYIRAGADASCDVHDGGNGTSVVSMARDELVGLAMQRNTLAHFLSIDAAVGDLPPMLSGAQGTCGRCFSSDSCMVQHRLFEGGDAESAGALGPGAQLFLDKTRHLADGHAHYYRFWRAAMAAEEAHALGGRAELWAMPARRREQAGRCWAGLQLVLMGGEGEGDIVMGRRLSFSFERGPAAAGEAEVFSRGSMSVGDYVAVSVQAWDVASCGEDAGALVPNMTSGFVDVVSAATVAVLVDRDIVHWCGSRSRDARRVVWRIDAEEIVASFSTAKATVESLFVADESGGNGKVRGLVADLRPPTFTPLDDVGLASIGSLADKLAERGMALNDEQTHALRRSREARDYMLLLGMPGTGKTATLATIVLAAVDSGQTVLLCSHTRTAVDNILVRLLDLGFTNFVRVGALGASGDGRLEPFHVPSESSLSVDELAQRLETPSVVATTCLGISHAVFARRTAFDLVLVDEASQILQPICIGPLRLASSAFVLVGDHYQLPPLLRSAGHRRAPAATADPAVADVAMDVCVPLGAGGGGENPRESLFRRLCEAHPEAVVSLVRQYRMAADIMRLSNTLVYSGHLSCGTPAVASRMLELHAGGPSNVPRWLGAVLNPARRVVFLDTDALGDEAADAAGPDPINEHRSKSSARQSPVEGAIIATAVAALCARGLAGDAIAVLSPFRAQVAHLRNVLQASVAGTGDVCTIDQYQGKDKECVFVSFVRSNEANSVGPLLLDWRRINVAITRARSKLILVGSASTLAGGSLFLREMVATLRTQGAIAAVDEPPSVPEQRTGDTSDPTGHTREAGTLDSAVKQGRTSGHSS